MPDPLVPVDLYGVIVLDSQSNSEWLDVSTLRYNADGARAAWREHVTQQGSAWKETNKPVRIKRFTLVDGGTK